MRNEKIYYENSYWQNVPNVYTNIVYMILDIRMDQIILITLPGIIILIIILIILNAIFGCTWYISSHKKEIKEFWTGLYDIIKSLFTWTLFD